MLISIRNSTIFAVFLGVLALSLAQAQSGDETAGFRHPDLNFVLRWPDTFEQIQTSGAPVVALALRKKGADFPTFNIISEAGSFDPGRDSLLAKAKLVRTNYRALALAEVKIRDKKLIDVGSGLALRIDLDYLNQTKKYRSVVVLVPGKMRHFILTYIDRLEDFAVGEAALNEVLQSFKIPDHVRSSGKADSFPPVWIVIAALLILVIIFRLKSRRAA